MTGYPPTRQIPIPTDPKQVGVCNTSCLWPDPAAHGGHHLDEPIGTQSEKLGNCFINSSAGQGKAVLLKKKRPWKLTSRTASRALGTLTEPYQAPPHQAMP
jgi:hypothetical protein